MLTRLNAILEEKLKELSQKKQLSKDERELLQFYLDIKHIFGAIPIQNNPIAIRNAIQHIEFITYKTQHSNIFNQHLQFLKYPTLNQASQVKQYVEANEDTLPKMLVDRLISWHVELMQRMAWEYSYPLTNGQVLIPGVKEWQDKMVEISQSNSYGDFQRNVAINGVLHTNQTTEQIDDAVRMLLMKTDFNEADKNKVSAWLIHNGGQDVVKCIDLIVENNEFILEQQLALANVSVLGMNWYVENKKLYFQFSEAIHSLTVNEISMMMFNSDKDKVEILSTGDAGERAQQRKMQNMPKSQALMGVACKIQLVIQQGIVMPKIVELSIVSMTDILLSPTNQKIKSLNLPFVTFQPAPAAAQGVAITKSSSAEKPTNKF